jgi:hypothetical protein
MNSQIDAGSARLLVRPEWREEFWHDLPAFERYSADMQAWQHQSDDPFERADVALWSRLSAPKACWVFNQTIAFMDELDAGGGLERARAAENEGPSHAGLPPLSERDLYDVARGCGRHSSMIVFKDPEADFWLQSQRSEAGQEARQRPHNLDSAEFYRHATASRKKLRAISPLRFHLSQLLRQFSLRLTLWAVSLEKRS